MVDLCTKTGKLRDIEHQQSTARWVKQLRPDADEALLTAAVAHDIERAVFGDWKAGSMDQKALQMHQEFSTMIMRMFLNKEGAPTEFIDRVVHLISHHEVGGDADQNLLCDADSLDYFEHKALRHVQNLNTSGRTKEWMRQKLDYMFNDRLKSQQAREIAKPWYDQALAELDAS